MALPPMHDAVIQGDLEAVRRHLDSGVPVDLQDDDGYTALLRASHFNRKEVAQLLIDRGADLNVQDKEGWTALKEAVARGFHEVAVVLEQAAQKAEKTSAANT